MSYRENNVTLLNKTGPTSQQSQFFRKKNPPSRRLGGHSPSGVTRVGVTRGGNWGCHPFFPEQNWRPF